MRRRPELDCYGRPRPKPSVGLPPSATHVSDEKQRREKGKPRHAKS
jgi:hypothetical protein